jgi:polyhydroxybutyrate depolymerase
MPTPCRGTVEWAAASLALARKEPDQPMMHHVLFLSCLAMAQNSLPPGDHTRSLEVGQRTRSYLVHIPQSYDGTKPVPVLLAFHGGGTHAQAMVEFSGLNEKAEQEGFVVVYPNGTGRLERILTFNAGNCCGYALQQKVDDVAFTRALLDDLARVVNVDAARIYATGMSNGAMICYLLASELSDRIAAIAPVGAPMGTETCHPQRPVPVMHFHGTDDSYAPFQGGKGKGLSGTDFYSVEHTILAWVKANGCQQQPTVVKLPTRVEDGTTVEVKTYGGGKQGSEVVLVVIHGGGHTWPGREPRARFLGKSTQNVSANDLMWEFFQKHALREPARRR